MSDWEPSDDRPLIDAPLPSPPTPQTPRAYTPTPASGPLVDIDEAELKRILSVPPALPRQQLPPALITLDKSKPGQSTSVSGPVTPPQETGASGSVQSWLYREAMTTPTDSQLPITPPMAPQETPPVTPLPSGPNKSWLYREAMTTPTDSQLPITPPTQPVKRNYEISNRDHEMAPDDWQPPSESMRSLSGELEVSSDVQQSSRSVGGRLKRFFKRLSKSGNPEDNLTPKQVLSNKTDRDSNKLRQRGFDIQYGQDDIGQGNFGTVFVGTYTPEISRLTETQRRYLGNVQPGGRFAAKYIQIEKKFLTRVFHEIEKQSMKRLGNHPNIAGFKIAINLGQRKPVLHNNGKDFFYSYDRMFLIMDMADKGSVDDFIQDQKVTDYYAILFMRDMCTGLQYMHQKGILHGDIHAGNVLLFTGSTNPDQLVAKYIDFGQSLARDHWSGSDLTDQEFDKLTQGDCWQMSIVFKNLITGAESAADRNTGLDLQPMRDMTARLNTIDTSGETLDTILKDIKFNIWF